MGFVRGGRGATALLDAGGNTDLLDDVGKTPIHVVAQTDAADPAMARGNARANLTDGGRTGLRPLTERVGATSDAVETPLHNDEESVWGQETDAPRTSRPLELCRVKHRDVKHQVYCRGMQLNGRPPNPTRSPSRGLPTDFLRRKQ